MSTPPQQGLGCRSCVIVCEILSVLGLGLFGFSNSAYASSSVSVSNTGKISFNKVQPGSSGSITTGQDTLSISTDCPAGVNVYVSGLSGKSTELINNTASSNNTIATVNSISTPTVLSNNTWGLTTSSTDASSNRYLGLPTFSDAMNHLFYAGNDATLPIYYGAKVTNTLATGTYTGEVLYTVTINNSCLDYTINFNQNNSDSGSSGTMDTQAILPTGGTLAQNSFVRPGYSFLGWSLSATGKTGNAVDGVGTAEDVDFTDKASFPGNNESVLPGSENTLYAIWAELTMQNWANEPNFGCGKLAIGEVISLTDYRDGNKYAVKKLPDGNCWMVENLRLTNYKLTPADSDVSSDFDMTEPNVYQSGDSNWCNASDTSCNDQISVYYSPTARKHSTENTELDYGALYNWYTATAGTGTYSTTTTPTSSICPSGWHLPFGGYAYDKSFYSLYHFIDNYSIMTGNYNLDNNAGFDYAGYISGTNVAASDYTGSRGYWWSSASRTLGYSYVMTVQSPSNINIASSFSRYMGASVRCVAASNASGSMQDFNTNTNLPNIGESTILMDKRDGKDYKVKRLPDGKVWMVHNLAIGMDGAKILTQEDTNIDNGTTYYLPPPGKKSSATGAIKNPATLNATATADFNSNGPSVQTQFKTKNSLDINISDTGYYNYHTASLGYSYYLISKYPGGSSTRDICPKGWRLPHTTDENDTVSTTDISNDFTYLALQYGPFDGGTATSFDYNSSDSTVWDGMIGDANLYFASYYGADNDYFSFYWSSSLYSSNQTYAFIAQSNSWPHRIYTQSHGYGVNSGGGFYMWSGIPVRCIAMNTYTINYDANGGTGEMAPTISSDTILKGSATLRRNTFEKPGVYFAGWSTDPNATSPTYADTATVSNLAPGGSSITLYAIWTDGKETMQYSNKCTELNIGETASLIDLRDYSPYTIKKFSDGSCWMIDNLILGHDGSYVLTKELTNITDDGTYYLPRAGTQSDMLSGDSTATNFDSRTDAYTGRVAYVEAGTVSNGYTIPQNTGYYNFYGATIGKTSYDGGQMAGYVERDICPKGWQMPVNDNSSQKSWYYFYNTLSRNSMFTDSAFSYSGYYDSSGGPSSAGTKGYWWSSSIVGSSYAYSLSLDAADNRISTGDWQVFYRGFPVRCVMK